MKIGKETKLDITFFCPCGRQPHRHHAILKRNAELSCQLFGHHVDDTNCFMCFEILNI